MTALVDGQCVITELLFGTKSSIIVHQNSVNVKTGTNYSVSVSALIMPQLLRTVTVKNFILIIGGSIKPICAF